MAFVILGLLHLGEMSLYDLARAFEQGISLFYSSSTGGLKRALDGLLAKGLIAVAEADAGPRGRKAYAITESGRGAFHEWMRAPLGDADLETATLSRLYFLGMLPSSERREVLLTIRRRIEQDLAELEARTAVVDSTPVPPEMHEMARYGRATLDYGLMSHRAALTWFTELLDGEGSSA